MKLRLTARSNLQPSWSFGGSPFRARRRSEEKSRLIAAFSSRRTEWLVMIEAISWVRLEISLHGDHLQGDGSDRSIDLKTLSFYSET